MKFERSNIISPGSPRANASTCSRTAMRISIAS